MLLVRFTTVSSPKWSIHVRPCAPVDTHSFTAAPSANTRSGCHSVRGVKHESQPHCVKRVSGGGSVLQTRHEDVIDARLRRVDGIHLIPQDNARAAHGVDVDVVAEELGARGGGDVVHPARAIRVASSHRRVMAHLKRQPCSLSVFARISCCAARPTAAGGSQAQAAQAKHCILAPRRACSAT